MAAGGRKRAGVGGELKAVLRKQRWSAAEAQAVLTAQQRSGSSLATFARRYGVSLSRLDACQRRLDRTSPRPAAPVDLVPVRLVDHRPQPDGESVELILRGGRRVRVRPGFDGRLLAQVIEVVEGLAC